MMIDVTIKKEILARLRAVEAEHSVKILYACESGSRAWGFPSPDSDYDVRFIYAQPTDWYLSFDVERRRDVIEYPIVDDIDCSGWDIRKALYLFTRTNGALLEWLQSPIGYIEQGDTAEALRQLASTSINTLALCYHYSHMARGNAREHLYQEQVKLKKYFYVLRPLLAIRYIEAYQQPPPVEFEQLVEHMAPSEIRAPIADLLALKRQTPELGLGASVPVLNDFITQELARHGDAFSGQGRPNLLKGDTLRAALNQIFKGALSQ